MAQVHDSITAPTAPAIPTYPDDPASPATDAATMPGNACDACQAAEPGLGAGLGDLPQTAPGYLLGESRGEGSQARRGDSPKDSPGNNAQNQAPCDRAPCGKVFCGGTCGLGFEKNSFDRLFCIMQDKNQKTINMISLLSPQPAQLCPHAAGQGCSCQCGHGGQGTPCDQRGQDEQGGLLDQGAPFCQGGQTTTQKKVHPGGQGDAAAEGPAAKPAGRLRASLALACCASMLLGSLGGCAHKDAPSESSIRAQEARFERQASSRAFEVADGAYLGCASVPLADESAPELQRRVRMKCRGSLAEAVRILQELSPVAIALQAGDAGRGTAAPNAGRSVAHGSGRGAKLGAGELAQPDLEALLGPDLAGLAGPAGDGGDGKAYDLPALVLDSAPEIAIDYQGPLKGLLDRLCAQAGLGWDYDRASQTVTLAHTLVRTFTINATPGHVASESRITNRTRDQEGASISAGSTVKQTARTSTADAQTAQTASTRLAFDAWQEILGAVKALLSPRGKVTASQAAGTITICDHPDSVRRAGRLIAEFNARFERQCALRVNVYSLELKDESSAGLDLKLLFQKATGADLAVQAGSLALAGAAGTTQAAVVKGDLKGSAGVLQALKAYGTATQVTSGGLVVRSGCPAPLQAIRKTGYLAGVASETTQYGQTTSVTPGEVSTGFAMTILPHILEGRRIALACTVHLSSLEALREYRSGSAVVQLPQTSSRAFQQSATLQAGQTLVLAGFQQAGQDTDVSAGLLSVSRGAKYSKSILIITIEVEMAPPGEAGLSAALEQACASALAMNRDMNRGRDMPRGSAPIASLPNDLADGLPDYAAQDYAARNCAGQGAAGSGPARRSA